MCSLFKIFLETKKLKTGIKLTGMLGREMNSNSALLQRTKIEKNLNCKFLFKAFLTRPRNLRGWDLVLKCVFWIECIFVTNLSLPTYPHGQMEQCSLSPNLAGTSQANWTMFGLLRTQFRGFYLGLKHLNFIEYVVKGCYGIIIKGS